MPIPQTDVCDCECVTIVSMRSVNPDSATCGSPEGEVVLGAANK